MLGGALITIMLMLYAAVGGIISIFNPEGESVFIDTEGDEDEE